MKRRIFAAMFFCLVAGQLAAQSSYLVVFQEAGKPKEKFKTTDAAKVDSLFLKIAGKPANFKLNEKNRFVEIRTEQFYFYSEIKKAKNKRFKRLKA